MMVWVMFDRLQQERAEDVEDSRVVLAMRICCPFIVFEACCSIMA